MSSRPKTHIIPFVDDIPKDLPGDDQVQAQLSELLKTTIVQANRIQQEDLDADNAEISEKIKFKVDEIKEKLLEERKKKAHELWLMREARRKKEREERNQEFDATYKEILRKEKEEKERAKAEEERKQNSILGKVKSGGQGLIGNFLGKSKLPGLVGDNFRPFSREKERDEEGGEVARKSGRASPVAELVMSNLPKIGLPSTVSVPSLNLLGGGKKK